MLTQADGLWTADLLVPGCGLAPTAPRSQCDLKNHQGQKRREEQEEIPEEKGLGPVGY